MYTKCLAATALLTCTWLSIPGASFAGGGPLGIDSRINRDEEGIWSRGTQRAVQYLTVGSVLAGALVEGSETRLGKTFWQSTDSYLLGQAGYLVLNNTLRRKRPSITDDPNQWFKSGGHSFPSGEVTAISSVITPIILEYGAERPWSTRLSYSHYMTPLPGWNHKRTGKPMCWQAGRWEQPLDIYYTHTRNQPFTVMILPHGLTVGWHTIF